MRRMIKDQSGITAIGIVLMLAVAAGVVLIALRLFPLFNEKIQIDSVMNTMIARPDAAKLTTKSAAKPFFAAIAVTNINRFTKKNLKEHLTVEKSKKKGEPKMLRMHYESRSPFFAEVEFVLTYDKKFPLTGPSAGG